MASNGPFSIECCGANKANYSGGVSRESYACPSIHDNFEKEFGNMKFDVIIGNPPYQLSDGGGVSGSAVPLYNKFIESAISLNPKYISMVIPSRWMIGGKGLTKFRDEMISDRRIKNIVDYELASDVFA